VTDEGGLVPSVGWGVLHLYYRVAADPEPRGAKRIVDAAAALEADGHQVLACSVLGHKADVGFMALGPDLARLERFQHEVGRHPLEPVFSFVSLTELSPYTSTEDDERARLGAEEGIADPVELERRIGAWRARMAEYREHRLHPRLPARALLCFYPMSKRRSGDDNWYRLPFEERKALMAGHARVGRRYAGRVLQLITGSTGLDDHEWGVTLLADDPVALKEIVGEMRFDEVSARYAEFGPFLVGRTGSVADVLARVGLAAT
jgi:chlorite dismutase